MTPEEGVMICNLLAFLYVGLILAAVTALLSLVLPVHGAVGVAVLGYGAFGLTWLMERG